MDIYEILKSLNIEYEEISHEPVFTVEQACFIKLKISGTGCKNLLLTDKKGSYILVVLDEAKKADIKKIAKAVNTGRLSFACNEELHDILSLESGSVSPLGIINDHENKVLVVIDKTLKDKRLLMHPNINTKTISLNYNDLIKFIEYAGNRYILI